MQPLVVLVASDVLDEVLVQSVGALPQLAQLYFLNALGANSGRMKQRCIDEVQEGDARRHSAQIGRVVKLLNFRNS